MQLLLQISALAATTIAADYTFHKYLCPKENNQHFSVIVVPKAKKLITNASYKVIQTMVWKIGSQTNSLLFDFSDLGIDLQDIFDIIYLNLSPNILTGIKLSSENKFLMEIMLESSNKLLLKQTQSIFKHRGIRMTPFLYLKPTNILLFDNQVNYWMIRIIDLPLEISLLSEQDEHKRNLSIAITNSFNQSAIIVKPKNLYYETVTRLSNTILTGTVIALVKEIVYKETFITTKRRFIYLSCYKNYFPIIIKSVVK